MEYSSAIILVALLQYLIFTFRVGFYRLKNNVSAPKTTGNEEWKIKFRIQQNTLEQLIVFIPSMLTFSYYVSVSWALLAGVLFVLGRQIYSSLSLKSPKIRGPGAVMSIFSHIALAIGSLIGLGLHILG